MKKLAAIGLLVVLVVSLIPSAVLADDSVLIYAGLADTPEELAFSVEHEGQKVMVFEGLATSDLDQVVLTLKGNRIYQGKVLTRDNVLFTVKGDHIIPGVDSRVSNALYTVRNGRIFAGNVTETINLVAQSFVRPDAKEGDEVLITGMEHHANIVPWQMLAEQTGTKLVVAPITDEGELILEEFDRLITSRTRLVSVTWVANALGTINPIEQMIEIWQKYR